MSFSTWNETGNPDLANFYYDSEGTVQSETAGEAMDTPDWIKKWVGEYDPKKKGDQTILFLIIAFLAIYFLRGVS